MYLKKSCDSFVSQDEATASCNYSCAQVQKVLEPAQMCSMKIDKYTLS